MYLKNEKPKRRESRNSDGSEKGNDKIIIQPSLKEQHLHHWQEKRLDSALLAQFRIFPRPHILARKEMGLLRLFSSISNF